MTCVNLLGREKLSVRVQTAAALAALTAAVGLPQVVHVLGAALGLGSGLGELLLPMHLPILLVGMMAGPWAGAAAGGLAPLVSVMLTGMPGQAMVPFLVVELCFYGLAAGLLRTAPVPPLAKVLLCQVTGRGIRALVILAAVGLGLSSVPVAVIWTSAVVGLPGIVLQWMVIPPVLRWVEARNGD